MHAIEKFEEMGKIELRAFCKKTGIKNYGIMNNDGMRACLAAQYPVAQVGEDSNSIAEKPKKNLTVAFGQLLGIVAPPSALDVGNKTTFVDGKMVGKEQKIIALIKDKKPSVKTVSFKGKTIQKNREERNGVKRPSEGGICGAVWAEFEKNPIIQAKQLNDLADKNGWNVNNVRCEFYNWRKFMGVKKQKA